METARALAHAGARVILTSRKVSAGEEVAAALKSAGVKASRWPKREVCEVAFGLDEGTPACPTC